jgi:hypothetical protein
MPLLAWIALTIVAGAILVAWSLFSRLDRAPAPSGTGREGGGQEKTVEGREGPVISGARDGVEEEGRRAAGAGWTIAGRVLRGGKPVEDALVDPHAEWEGFDEIETPFTDASGDCSVDLPGPGKYRLTVSIEGSEVFQEELVVPRGLSELRQDIDLPPQ